MDRLDETLRFLSRELVSCNVLPQLHGEYAIFGSASLVMRGILDREPGDIDVHFSRKLWGRMLDREGWFVETPKAGDPPILSNETPPIPIHAFYDWSDVNVLMDVPDLISRAETVEVFERTYQAIPVEDALNHKKFALAYSSKRVAKHIPDIAVIEEWLKDHPQSWIEEACDFCKGYMGYAGCYCSDYVKRRRLARKALTNA